METKQELVTTVSKSPAEIMASMLEKGLSPDNMLKMLEVQERWEGNEAKKEYHKAMAEFKANPPDIEKDKKVAYGTTKYNHASLSNVTTKINEALSKHGLSASWQIKQNGTVCVTCKITHIKGHSEETTLSAPSDTSGSKNAIQAIGSTITYLQRYSILAVCGLATGEHDDDGNTSTELITEAEAESLMEHLQSAGANVPKFLAYMKVEKLTDIPKSELKRAMSVIEDYKAKAAK